MSDALDYINSLQRFGMKLELATTEQLVEALGHPEEAFPTIHVAGTNGKGSVCAMVASILQAAGYTVGLYTSPHLFRFHERIRVNGEEITEEELTTATDQVRAAAVDLSPTIFEFTTAVAFCHFRNKGVDIAVIEVGLGGRLDATNVITPLVSVITNIGRDHMQHLGNTREEIAREKGGIIKPGVPLVTHEQKLFEEHCAELESPLISAAEVAPVRTAAQNFKGQTIETKNGMLLLPLLGEHQRENAEVALATLEELQQHFMISQDAIEKGLANVSWPGRLHVVQEQPLVIVDGAHNATGLAALATYLETIPQRKVLVLGLSEGREVEECVNTLVPSCTRVICTEAPHAAQPAERIAAHVTNAEVEPNPERALQQAKQSLAEDECLVVAGSLYLVPTALTVLRP